MKIVSISEIRSHVKRISEAVIGLGLFLEQEELLIADIPAPEKKVRKRTVKKDKGSTQEVQSKSPIEKPHRGRRKGSKNKTPFGPPQLREGEEPV